MAHVKVTAVVVELVEALTATKGIPQITIETTNIATPIAV